MQRTPLDQREGFTAVPGVSSGLGEIVVGYLSLADHARRAGLFRSIQAAAFWLKRGTSGLRLLGCLPEDNEQHPSVVDLHFHGALIAGLLCPESPELLHPIRRHP